MGHSKAWDRLALPFLKSTKAVTQERSGGYQNVKWSKATCEIKDRESCWGRHLKQNGGNTTVVPLCTRVRHFLAAWPCHPAAVHVPCLGHGPQQFPQELLRSLLGATEPGWWASSLLFWPGSWVHPILWAVQSLGWRKKTVTPSVTAPTSSLWVAGSHGETRLPHEISALLHLFPMSYLFCIHLLPVFSLICTVQPTFAGHSCAREQGWTLGAVTKLALGGRRGGGYLQPVWMVAMCSSTNQHSDKKGRWVTFSPHFFCCTILESCCVSTYNDSTLL